VTSPVSFAGGLIGLSFLFRPSCLYHFTEREFVMAEKASTNWNETLNRIPHFLRVDDRLATSGMPQPDDFAALRQGASTSSSTSRCHVRQRHAERR